MKKIAILLIAPLFFAASCRAEYAPGELVVKFKPGVIKLPKGLSVAALRAATVTVASVRALNTKYQVARFRQVHRDALAIRPDWKHLEDEYILELPPDKDSARAAKDYKKDASVVFANPNFLVRAFAPLTPNDTYYSEQWGLAKISAPQGWDRTTGTNETIVAVLDTGLNYNHEDFDGKVDRTHAKDYVNGDNDPLDDYGHGTAVSGIIGAVTNNAKGIAGMDWRAKILPIKVLDNEGRGLISNVTTALSYLAGLKSTGVNIRAINMSLGQYNQDVSTLHDGVYEYQEQDPSNLKERCAEAYNQGIILVAAAGNGDVDWNTYPAYYPTVMAVAATDSSDKRSVWTGTDLDTGRTQASNYASWVAMSAPGTDIFTTDMGGGYSGGWKGTSLASPFVAGLAALMRAILPSLSNDQLIDRMKSTADDIDSLNPGYEGKLGSGRANAYLALAGLLAEISSPASGAYIKGTKEIDGQAAGWNFSNYVLDALRSGSVEATIKNSTVSVESGKLADWDTSGLNGNFTLRLKVFATDASSNEASISVIVDNTAPEAAITLPAAGSTVEGAVTITGKARDDFFDRYLIEYGAGASPPTFETIGIFYTSVESGALATWETSGLSGNYTLKLTAYDRAGTSSIASETLNILSHSATKEAEPRTGLPLTFALPNPFVRSTATAETTFVYDLKGNFNVTIYLFDLNGSLIWRRSFGAGENGGKAGANNPAWNGKNLFGEDAATGVYLYQITADQKIVARGRIIVLY